MILTAAGTADRPLGLGGLRRHPLLGFGDKKDDKNASLLTQAIFGDIGGVLIPRQPESDKRQDARAQKTLNDLTHRWTGLRIEHLSACATRAFEDPSKDRPGVTLLTFGADHSEIVIEAVRRGLANHLIIGSDLEQALLESQDVPLVLHEDNGSSKLPRRRRRASTLQDL